MSSTMAMKHFSEKKITYLHCWWECKLVQALWKTVWRLLKKLKIRLLYDQAIPLLGIYPEKNVYTHTHTHTRAHTHTHTGILFSHQKEWNNAICSNTNGPRDDHTKWSQKEKEKYHMVSLICGIKKYKTNQHTYKTKIDSYIENRRVVAKREARGMEVWR